MAHSLKDLFTLRPVSMFDLRTLPYLKRFSRPHYRNYLTYGHLYPFNRSLLRLPRGAAS